MPLSLARRNDPPRVDPEFAALIAPLTKEERAQLEQNIAAEGCRDALVVWKGVLLDGHNRLEICTRLGVRYKISQVELKSREQARVWIEENQIGRRNLCQDQRAAIAYRILQRRVALSKVERARKGGLRLVAESPLGGHASPKNPRERERTAKQLGISSRQVRLVAEIVKHSPEMLERIVAGTLTIKQAKQQLVEDSRNAKRLVALKTNPRGCRIHTGDLSLLDRLIPDNSADLFLTDPPYHEDAIPLYGRLAELAARKLKPGALCVVMCGQMHFDRVMLEMAKHLQYYWFCAVGQKSVVQSSRIVTRKVLSTFKPLLIFAKPPVCAPASRQFFEDLILGTKSKEHHKWGQGVEQFQYYVEHLSEPGQLVVDPFVGGGTTPIACLSTGRRYIGTELNPGVAASARLRIATFQKAKLKTH